MVQGGRPCKGALGLVLLAAPEQENEYISLRPSNFINTYFIHRLMDINSLDAALTGGHRSRIAKVMQRNIAHLKFVYTYSSTHIHADFIVYFFTHIQLCAPLEFDYIPNLCSNTNLTLYFKIISHTCRLFRSSHVPHFVLFHSNTITKACSMWSAGVTQTVLIVYTQEEELVELWRSRELLSCSFATVNGNKCRISRFSRQRRHTNSFWFVFMSI